VSAALEAKLDSVVTQLKNIASGGFTYKTVADPTGRPVVKAKVDKQEAEKLKITAKIQAEVSAQIYKKVLGLGFNEEKEKKTAKIFKDVFGMGVAGGGFSKKSTKDSVNYLLKQMEWFDFAGDLLHYAFNTQEYQEEMLHSMRTLIGLQPNSKDKKKTDSSGGLMDKLKSIAGLAVLGTGFFLIINALSNAGKIDIEKTLKILLLIGGIIGIFFLISKIAFNIIGATLVLGGMIYLIGYLAKNLEKFAGKDWESIDAGLKRAGIAMVSMVAINAILAKAMAQGGPIGIVAGVVSGAIMYEMVYLIGYLAENLEKFSGKDWNTVDAGLKRAGIAIGSLVAINVILAEALAAGGPIGIVAGVVSGAIMYEMVYLIGYLAENLEKFAGKDWESVDAGLKRAGVTMGSLVAVAGILAAAMTVGGPLAIVAGAVSGGIMWALAEVMNTAADALIKFASVDGKNLTTIAEGMVAIGAGLVAMMGGTVLGTAGTIVDKLASFVKLDPVSFLKKFEVLDGAKLLNIGTGIKYLAEGFKILSQGIEIKTIANDLILLTAPIKNLAEGLKMLSQGIEIKNIVNDLLLLTTPLLSFTGALDSFSNSYKQLEKIKMESEINQNYNMNLKSDTGIQKAILDLHAQELSVQQAQLEQLKINGNLLYQLVSNGGTGGSVSVPQQTINIKSPNFSTKENFMNNMKLTSMSLQQ
jgi:hypothetical protein